MRNRAAALFVAAMLLCPVVAAAQPALAPYNQDFELLVQTDTDALANDGWFVYGNVFSPDGLTYLYGYGPFVAPNDGAAFCAIALLEGGPDQGIQQLSVYSDYQNVDHAVGNIIESNVYREWMIQPADVGHRWTFVFDAKLGNLKPTSTALAFIKTLDPDNGWELTNFVTEDMTFIPETWTNFSISLTIYSGLVGQLFQIGFLNTATLYQDSGVFYDNIVLFSKPVSAPEATVAMGATLRQNYPNPFNPSTQIEFSLDRPGNVELSIFDVAGRKVATLHQGELGIGEHQVIWNGRTDSGAHVASGQYSYVLKTPSGQLARSMVLVK